MKHKLATIGFSYLVGLICASFLKADFLLISAALLLALSVIFRLTKHKSVGVGLFTAAAAFGVWFVYYAVFIQPVQPLYGSTVQTSGTILDKTEQGNDLCSYIAEAEINGVKVKITIFGADSYAEIGDKAAFSVKLSPLADNASFAESAYYSSKGVTAKGTLKEPFKVIEHGENPLGFIGEYRQYISGRIKQRLGGDEGSLICAMFLGDKSGLSYDLQNAVKRSGIAHFTAVSGLHLTVAAHIIMKLFSKTRFRKRTGIQFMVLGIAILWFMVFFNLSASVIRSGIMLIIYYGAAPLHRKGDTLNSLGCAVLAITLFSPYACTDIGFLMSVLGTIGVGVAAPKVCMLFKSARFHFVKSTVVGTVCAMLCTLPVTVVFGGISVAAPITNLLLIPLFMVIMNCLVLFTFIGGFGSVLLFIAGLSAKIMLAAINFFSALRYAYIPIDYDFAAPFFVVSGIFILVVSLLLKSTEKTAKAAVISVCAFAAMIIFSNLENLFNTEITVYSDGSSGAVIVYDCKSSCVIATDSSPKTIMAVKEYMQNRFMDKFNVIAVRNDTKNNISQWSGISCDLLVMPDETGCFDISGQTVLNINDFSAIEVNGIRLSVSSLKNEIPNADISVIYDYKTKYPDTENTYNIYISKRMDQGLNAYYNSVSFIVKPDGTVREVIK